MARDKQSAPPPHEAEAVKIWDWPTRLVHWALALLVPASWVTANAFDLLAIHMVLGYITLGLVAFRVLWGLVGPRHARFSNFLTGPTGVWRYARTLARRDSTPSAGHNPVGALAIVLMLGMLGLQATTGLFTSDELAYFGPWNGAVSSSTAKTLGSLHAANGQLIPWVIALHLLAVFWYAAYKRQNLIGPMVTGRKPSPPFTAADAIRGEGSAWALLLAAVVAGGVWALVALAPPPAMPDGLF